MKILIVGCGYAGSLLNYFLFKKGVEVHIVDRNEAVTSTKVSAGIMLPLTGRRIVKTFNADKIIPFANASYSTIEKESGLTFLKNKQVLQIFNSPGNMNEWIASSADDELKNYIGKVLAKNEIHTTILNELGGVLLNHCAAVNPVTFIKAVEQITSITSFYHKTSFHENDLQIKEDCVVWNNESYSHVIFCEGYEITSNKWFSYIPFKPAKGEILNFHSDELSDTYIVNGNVFILPEGNGNFRAGSTYNWKDLSPVPTTTARETLEDGIRKTINCNFEITGHHAGIRPAIIDRRPVLGFHKQLNQLGIFNGLGTKGAMLAPYYANKFAEFIVNNTAIDSDVSIIRFEKLRIL